MAFANRVVWSEGMFIRAQHFQQDARYTERLVRGRVAALRGYGWGLSELKLNHELLSTGRFAAERAAGVFEDGTPFVMPDDTAHPEPLLLPASTRNCIVYLSVPISQPGGFEAAGASSEIATRFRVVERDVPDANAGESELASIQVGELRLSYTLESEERAGFHHIGLARITEVRADNSVVLDNNYIPPLLDSAVSPYVTALLNEMVGLLNHRGEAIASRLLAGGGTGTLSDMTDTLMLQVINRWQPVLEHLAGASTVHPETVFMAIASLAGELSTFTSAERRPRSLPAYRHDQLQLTFAPVVMAVRQALSTVLDQGAVAIPLTEHRYGIRVAEVPERSMFARYSFFLAAKANMPAEVLMRGLVGQVKIGPVEQIRDLVNTALAGVPLRGLPVAPRQIPYHTGKAYCELDRSSPLWRQFATSSGMALHVGGDFPGLELELWAVKD
ncbi:type VI secretion protein [Aureimonas ureilytica]|uniref:Type VI secretion protein n=1 Tax=Aureimonas ureilytica TaxID=401562 RepID=A0A175RBJ6_9HYPH|nr:type VI secretion system baseplate subunit TssK [Aureimonas ureilytica]KTQ97323.1 type VI secretion protein [Aureimonas ureilytica]